MPPLHPAQRMHDLRLLARPAQVSVTVPGLAWDQCMSALAALIASNRALLGRVVSVPGAAAGFAYLAGGVGTLRRYFLGEPGPGFLLWLMRGMGEPAGEDGALEVPALTAPARLGPARPAGAESGGRNAWAQLLLKLRPEHWDRVGDEEVLKVSGWAGLSRPAQPG